MDGFSNVIIMPFEPAFVMFVSYKNFNYVNTNSGVSVCLSSHSHVSRWETCNLTFEHFSMNNTSSLFHTYSLTTNCLSLISPLFYCLFLNSLLELILASFVVCFFNHKQSQNDFSILWADVPLEATSFFSHIAVIKTLRTTTFAVRATMYKSTKDWGSKRRKGWGEFYFGIKCLHQISHDGFLFFYSRKIKAYLGLAIFFWKQSKDCWLKVIYLA